jgi:hypothetical protein
MRLTGAMNQLDYLGAEGGRLALAFAAGCVATFAFMTAIGSFFWKLLGGHRKDRITDLENDLAAERENCRLELSRQSDRIQQLETLFTLHTGIRIAEHHLAPAGD